jgi:hypothetical protein
MNFERALSLFKRRRRYGTQLPPAMRNPLVKVPRSMAELKGGARSPKGAATIAATAVALFLAASTIVGAITPPPVLPILQINGDGTLSGSRATVGATSFIVPSTWAPSFGNTTQIAILYAPQTDRTAAPATITVLAPDVSDMSALAIAKLQSSSTGTVLDSDELALVTRILGSNMTQARGGYTTKEISLQPATTTQSATLALVIMWQNAVPWQAAPMPTGDAPVCTAAGAALTTPDPAYLNALIPQTTGEPIAGSTAGTGTAVGSLDGTTYANPVWGMTSTLSPYTWTGPVNRNLSNFYGVPMRTESWVAQNPPTIFSAAYISGGDEDSTIANLERNVGASLTSQNGSRAVLVYDANDPLSPNRLRETIVLNQNSTGLQVASYAVPSDSWGRRGTDIVSWMNALSFTEAGAASTPAPSASGTPAPSAGAASTKPTVSAGASTKPSPSPTAAPQGIRPLLDTGSAPKLTPHPSIPAATQPPVVSAPQATAGAYKPTWLCQMQAIAIPQTSLFRSLAQGSVTQRALVVTLTFPATMSDKDRADVQTVFSKFLDSFEVS